MVKGKGSTDERRIPPGLHLVSTPIGAARDITLRALDVLGGADVLAAEDTRTLRHLMEIHGVPVVGRTLISYHDHNGDVALPRLIGALKDGMSVAYASDAGTPLVADPGLQLARAAIAEGVQVIAVPGASAALCALTVSGIASDRFTFIGFLPSKSAARKAVLREVERIPSSLIFYETPHRLSESLKDMQEILGENRTAAVCREMTKKFEEIVRGRLGRIAQDFDARTVKGEIVVVVERGGAVEVAADELETTLRDELKTLPVKEASTAVARKYGVSRRDAYQMALKLKEV